MEAKIKTWVISSCRVLEKTNYSVWVLLYCNLVINDKYYLTLEQKGSGIHVDRAQACKVQTDRQTDRQTDTVPDLYTVLNREDILYKW